MPAISLLDYANQTDAPKKSALVQKIANESVFLKLLRFIPCDPLLGYRYNLQSTLGGIAFRGLNGSYTADAGIINPMIETTAIFGGLVDTDRQLANAPNGQSVRTNHIMAKTKKAGLFFDKYVIDGDPATNPLQFYGLNARLTGANVTYMGDNGAALTLAALDAAIDYVVGTDNSQKAIICNKTIRRKITNLVVAAAGGAAVLDVGRQLVAYNNCPIHCIDEDGDEAAILGFDETRGSSDVTTSLYVVRPGTDTEGENLQGIVGSNMIEHVAYGERNAVVQDLVEANLGIALFHPRAAVRIAGITNA